MASRKSRSAELDEKLDANSINKVIAYLKEKGSTKKHACQMLNISYNTSRLDKLVADHIAREEADAKRRAEKRGTVATDQEIEYVVTEYLQGAKLENISKSLFRGTTFVKSILERMAVPLRKAAQDYFNPNLIPDEAVRSEFRIGEVVYSAKYDALAEIRNEVPHKEGKVYRIYLHGDKWGGQQAYQPAWELASLDKIREAGVRI